MIKAVRRSEPNTIPATSRARFCEHTATPLRPCRPPLESPPATENKRNETCFIKCYETMFDEEMWFSIKA